MSHDPYAALRFPEYRAYLGAMASASVGTQIQTAVLGWQVYELTGDPLSLGLVGLSEAVPFLALTLVGGWAADRVDRRTLSLAGLVTIGISGLCLLLLSLGTPSSALPFYGAQALAGLGRAFFRPAYAALGTELVPREHYQNAATWRSSVFHTAQVLGPALGGGLLFLGGPYVAYAVVIGLVTAGVLLFAVIGARPRAPAAPGRLVADLGDGIRFVFVNRLLLGAMSLDLFAVLFGGAAALLPVFAKEILDVGEVGFGFMRAAPAAGSVLMALALARFGGIRRAGPILLWAVVFFGLTWIGFAFSRWYAVSLLLLAMGGAFDCVSVVLRSTLVQTLTPQDKMGRVAAVNGFFIGSSNELGAFESGVAARLLGTVNAVVFGGVMTLVTVGVIAWRVPSLRTLGRIEHRESGVETGSQPGT